MFYIMYNSNIRKYIFLVGLSEKIKNKENINFEEIISYIS